MSRGGKPLQLVKADLLDASGWTAAAAGCDFVVHVASPVLWDVPASQGEARVVKPAVDGTLNVLRAAANAGVKVRIIFKPFLSLSCSDADLGLGLPRECRGLS
jgi:nucleoside-diphosphate-sugar epimerase